ncbi:MAG: amidohydrolase [Anaerolineae bacterium]|nr:amidohydrolase [Anaerolineae bacterium]
MLLFYNGTIHTMDGKPADVVVVDDRGLIVYAGDFAHMPTYTQIRRVDLDGRTLIPGFNDAHVHIWKLGLLLTIQVDARGAAAPNIPAIIVGFAERAAKLPPGTWITGRGYNEAQLPERRHLTRYDLDQASPNHPMALTRTCGHMIVANSLALKLAGIDRATPNPPGGVIVRDEQGEPTGLVQETAMGLITRAMPDIEDEIMGRGIREAMYHQLRLGITSATDPLLTPAHVRVYRQLEAAGDLPVRVNGLPIRRPDGVEKITYPLPEKYVSDTLRIDCVKFFADGGLSGATAAISTPYKETGNQGVLRFEDEELLDLAWEAHAAGFRIATHAIGDVALEQVISVYEELHRRKPGLRHRIEHVALPAPGHLQRMQAIGTMAVPQSVFLYALGANYRRYIPDALLPGVFPIRDMIDTGLPVALSSDAPVVPDDNPLLGMKAALDRCDASGQPFTREQGISAYEALYAYTMGGAIASGDEANRGSVTRGKWADMVILSGDPLITPPADLPNLVVEQTYVGGRLVYER